MAITDNLISASKHLYLLLIAALVLFAVSIHAEDAGDLFAQIQALQNQNKIQIIGLERIQNAAKVPTSGSLEQQVKQLFAAYNHIVSRNTKGQIDRVVIINKKQKHKDNRIVLPASLKGKHSTVSVALSGDGRIWQTVDMVIDTGADLVVLPESMIDQLGFAERNLL